MGDIIYIKDYLDRKASEKEYAEFSSEMYRLYPVGESISVPTKYSLAVEKQQNPNYYLYVYFHPDYDW
jgi:hypothetical protein